MITSSAQPYQLNVAEYKTASFFLFGFSATLPLHENVNTWFLIGLVLLSLFFSVKYKLFWILKENWLLVSIPSILFLLRLIGITYAIDVENGVKETVRSVSFVFIPFVFLILSQIDPKNFKKLVFNGLVFGCVLAVLICWANAASAVIRNNEPITNLFKWKRSNEYLTRIINIHPPYLGMLILTSIIYLCKEYVHNKIKPLKRNLSSIVIFVFVVFMFHLVARNSLLTLMLFSVVYILYFKKWKLLFLGLILTFSVFYVIIEGDNNFLQRKYYKMLDFTNEDIGDKRFSRFYASWEVFKDHPVFGPGIGNDNILREEQYRLKGYDIAFEKKLNAHNQFIEYLSTFGVLGFLIFCFTLIYFLKAAFNQSNYFNASLLILFAIACLTESVLERELGIKYFSLILGIIIYDLKYKKIKTE